MRPNMNKGEIFHHLPNPFYSTPTLLVQLQREVRTVPYDNTCCRQCQPMRSYFRVSDQNSRINIFLKRSERLRSVLLFHISIYQNTWVVVIVQKPVNLQLCIFERYEDDYFSGSSRVCFLQYFNDCIKAVGILQHHHVLIYIIDITRTNLQKLVDLYRSIYSKDGLRTILTVVYRCHHLIFYGVEYLLLFGSQRYVIFHRFAQLGDIISYESDSRTHCPLHNFFMTGNRFPYMAPRIRHNHASPSKPAGWNSGWINQSLDSINILRTVWSRCSCNRP